MCRPDGRTKRIYACHSLHAMRKLDRECMSQRCASVLTPVLPIAHKTTTFLLKLAVWACVFVVVVGPVCK